MRNTALYGILLLAVLLSAGASGCLAQEPTAPVGTWDAAGHADGGTGGRQPRPDMADDHHVDPPVLDPIARETEYDTVPVHGLAEANSTVLVERADGSTVKVDVGPTGAFCIDLPLLADQLNNFSVSAFDLNGNQSDPVSVAVRQQGTPQQQAPADTPKNAAIGGVARSYSLGYFTQPNDAVMIDDDVSTDVTAHWSDASWSPPVPSVVVRLNATSRINQVKAIAPTGCLFKQTMDLYISSADAPTAPPKAEAGVWTKLPTVRSDDQLTATASFNSAIATHVALVFTGASGFGNCGWTYAEFGVAEVQAWTVPNAAPPPPRAPSCNGGAQ